MRRIDELRPEERIGTTDLTVIDDADPALAADPDLHGPRRPSVRLDNTEKPLLRATRALYKTFAAPEVLIEAGMHVRKPLTGAK